MAKVILFSVTAKDCEWQTMAASSKGGQHANRTETGVRCIHRESGAVGVSREFKSQIQNKRAAFYRMATTKRFTDWDKLETARRMQEAHTVEQMIARAVDESMQPRNIKVEVRDEKGRWVNV